ncbi:MAG TPA: hypothetical protein VJ991_00430 [Balneolales bacterium]|nr:hypothetical protein [Balneolales bacterium]
MENGARVFAYVTFSTMIGIAIYLFTHRLFIYVESPGIIGIVALAGFFLVYGNMAFALARRFVSKAMKGVNFPYVLGLLLVVPTMLYIAFQPQTGVHKSMPVLFMDLAIAGLLGSFWGIKSGLKKRNKRLTRLQKKGKNQSNHSVSNH